MGILLFAPLIPDLWIKVTFAVLWGSFGVLHLYRVNEIAGHTGIILSLGALCLCLLGFEQLRLWGAVLVGEINNRREMGVQEAVEG